jgi:hypothetical protein
MTMAIGESASSWFENFVATLRKSPKKAGTLSVLFVLLVGLWFRLLSGGHTTSSARGSAIVNPGVTTWAAPAGPAPGRVETNVDSLQQWARQPVIPLNRNIFIIPLDQYLRDGSESASVESTGNGFWDLLGKSMSSRADQQEQRQILIDNVRIAAGSLTLQSTLMGAQPLAMINGAEAREGSLVEGFRVVKIEARKVIVEREGVTLAIVMN